MKFSRLSLSALCLGAALAFAQAEAPRPPKLVVAIVVDQLRSDYLDRFREQFGEGGFRLLLEKGAFMANAHYNYGPTVTGPGHASFLSGAPPAVHGVIGNEWFDKRTRKIINCVSDPDVQGVGGAEGEGKRSPRNFTGSNFSDEMRLRFQSKVVGVSLKDRGAILPSGKKPAGAYWFDSASGNFITSTYYRAELPAWVKEFNDRKRPQSFVGQTWKRLLDASAYQWPDELPGEGMMPREQTSTFDHVVPASVSDGFETIVPTPFGNQLLAEFALAALDGEQLGRSAQPDVLTISFSSTDAIGHLFGPYSQEAQDAMLRLDRDLAQLFSAIDAKIGLANVAIVLSADHGVVAAPEFSAAQGLDGKRIDLAPLMAELQMKLAERFGEGSLLLTPRPVDGQIYFDHDALRARQLEAESVAGFIREWALATGVYQAAFTRWQLLDGRTPGLLGQRVLNGYNPERSGDVVLLHKPFQLPGTQKRGTTHGSPYSYDTHIPVLFFGAAFKPGRFADEFFITDIAPTLSAALHVSPPSGSMGKVCVKVLAEQL